MAKKIASWSWRGSAFTLHPSKRTEGLNPLHRKMGTFERLYQLLKKTLRGVAAPSLLQSVFAAQGHELLAQLPRRPRDPAALQSVRDDPLFSHCGVHLEPLGRKLVLQLADELHISELLCWELLLAASASVKDASQPAALKQASSHFRGVRRVPSPPQSNVRQIPPGRVHIAIFYFLRTQISQ